MTTPLTARDGEPEPELPASPSAPVVVLGLVAAPGAPADVADSLSGDLAQALTARHPDVTWDVRSVVDGLVQPPFDVDELVDAARRSDYPELAWLISSLGAGLESDDAVRQAACSYRPDRAATAD